MAFRLSDMQKESEKRVEWERLLVSNRAPVFGDLPEDLHKLLEQLDERLASRRPNRPKSRISDSLTGPVTPKEASTP